MYTTPLYFVRSGIIDLPTAEGRLNGMGREGCYWSSVVISKVNNITGIGVHYLSLGEREVYPNDGPYYRWRGRPLRGLGSGGKSHANVQLGHWM